MRDMFTVSVSRAALQQGRRSPHFAAALCATLLEKIAKLEQREQERVAATIEAARALVPTMTEYIRKNSEPGGAKTQRSGVQDADLLALYDNAAAMRALGFVHDRSRGWTIDEFATSQL